jgi:hypothetical protein
LQLTRALKKTRAAPSTLADAGRRDKRTCAPGSTWFDDSVGADDSPGLAGGIFDFANPDNPFKGWSFVGCSAGSVGSAFHAPAIISHFPQAQVAQLGDSLAFLFHRPIRLGDWGTPQHFPPFFRIGNRRFTMAQYLRALTKRYPRRRFARFNYASDHVQERFYAAIGGDPANFERQLRAVERSLAKGARNYRSYLACGDAHCVLPFASFHSLRLEGVSLRDWVSRLAPGGSVGCVECKD